MNQIRGVSDLTHPKQYVEHIPNYMFGVCLIFGPGHEHDNTTSVVGARAGVVYQSWMSFASTELLTSGSAKEHTPAAAEAASSAAPGLEHWRGTFLVGSTLP